MNNTSFESDNGARQEPREIHENALSERRQAAGRLRARANAIANVRLILILAIIALIIAFAWAHLPRYAWLGVLGLVIAFGAIVIVHARVHTELERMLAAQRFHENAIARMDGKWRSFPSTGETWGHYPGHPFAGDLDIFGRASLFQLLDATSTRFGEEMLASLISSSEPPWVDRDTLFTAVRARQKAVADLAPRLRLREELSVIGSLVEDEKPDPRPFVNWVVQTDASHLPGALRIVAVILPVLSVAAAIGASMGIVPRVAFLVSFALSVMVLMALSSRISPILNAASSKENALSRYAGMLALLENESFEADALIELQQSLREGGVSATREMASLSRIVGFLDARNNEVFRFFIGPILMWDLWCALALDGWRTRVCEVAFGWFSALADLEMLSSFAGFSFERPNYVFPELVEEDVFEATSLGHPLIDGDKRVPNDVSIEGSGHALVVTGSNMSGKSTLLRAIGINVVLAKAGAPVCAASMRIGRVRVATSMRVSDSLEEGTSHFYAELKKLKLVLEMAREQSSYKKDRAKGAATLLFLLDEILHGTNTRERLIGARAILRELIAEGAMGAVSTHDLALGDLEDEMPECVRNVHFEEQVEGDVMTFDYRLRPGIVHSSNALRLMKIVGLGPLSI
ncbi:MAG: DNA mismatch repair protein MutS [Polyangiaceae bacterium]|nr:DNA mismatch repair protein MutS [Polyangiaceae bacterium]